MQVVNFIPNKLDTLIKNGKDSLKKEKNTGVVYKIDCKNCNKSYIGETKRQAKTRLTERKSKL